MNESLYSPPLLATRRKREPSFSDLTSEDSKKLKIGDETRLASGFGGFVESKLANCSRCPSSPLEPISEGASVSGAIAQAAETFDELCVYAGNTFLAYQDNVTNMIYDTLFVEDLPSTAHLRTTVDASTPFPRVALRVHCFSNSESKQLIPEISLKCAPELSVQCNATLSSLHLPVIPCQVNQQCTYENQHAYHKLKINAVASPSDLYGSVLHLNLALQSGDKDSSPRTVAALFFDFQRTEGDAVMSLYKLARRSRHQSEMFSGPAIAPPPRTTRGRFRSNSGRQPMRPKPNLSLSIPPPLSAISFVTVGRSTFGPRSASATTPMSAVPMVTPLDQRIQTPLAPPPITTDINALSLQRFAGTPTDPLTPSLSNGIGGRHTAGTCISRLTKRAMEAGTPVLVRDSAAFPLASPMVARTPGIPMPLPMRRSSSLCTSTPDSIPTTPGGYFRPIAAPSVLKRSLSLCLPSTPGVHTGTIV